MDTDASSERRLPAEVLARAVMSGREYAWRVADIPMVTEAARKAELASIGGQLQFLIPTGGTCECYWVEVDPSKQLQEGLEWPSVVAKTHDIALREDLKNVGFNTAHVQRRLIWIAYLGHCAKRKASAHLDANAENMSAGGAGTEASRSPH
jgi:hypothetical protein